MKRISFCLFIILSYTSYGQLKIFNLSLTDSSLDIVYLGVDNNLSLITGSQNITKVTSLNATLVKTGLYTYIMKPMIGDSAILYSYNNDSLIFKKAFGIHRLAYPATK